MTRLVRSRLKVGLLCTALGVAVVPLGYASPGATAPDPHLTAGKQLYRQYCSQCHLLAYTIGAGFGRGPTLGVCCGPDFRDVRVPYGTTIVAVAGGSDGHERVVRIMSAGQVRDVAHYLALATKNHSQLFRASPG